MKDDKKMSDHRYYEKNKEYIKKHVRDYYQSNREKCLKYAKEYRNRPEKNKKLKQYLKEYRLTHLEKRLQQNREYYQKNKEKWREYEKTHKDERKKSSEKSRNTKNAKKRKREYDRLYNKYRYHTDTNYKLRKQLHNMLVCAVLRENRSKRTLELLGCNIEYLKKHLEKQFKPGMTWENHGPVWHIDHIKPIASFDLINIEEQKRCFNYNNLQPLYAEENMSKGRKENYAKTNSHSI